MDDAVASLEIDRQTAAKLLARWAEQGWLKRLRRGVYSPIPVDAVTAHRTLKNPWILVPELFSPGYVGGWSAAEHWSLTEQIFRDVCVFTTRSFRRKHQSFEGIGFVLNRTSQTHLFGLDLVWEASVRIPVSDPHRTILDMLARPAAGGGIRHVEDCLRSYFEGPTLDLKRLFEYADRLGNGAVYKRMGFLLERAELASEWAIATCQKRMSAGHATLDPSIRSDRMVARWRLWVPAAWKVRAPRD